MKSTQSFPANLQGFSLIEFVFWIVVVSVIAAGMIPLVGQVLSSLHLATEGMQAHLLAQAVVEQMNGVEENRGFDQIQGGACLKPDGVTPWVGAGLPFTCQITLWKAEPKLALNTVECTNQAYVDGDPHKCLLVALRHTPSNEPLAQIRALFSRPAADSL